MPEIELSSGVIEYQDTGGSGPVLVFLHGVLIDEMVWRHVVDELQDEHRCVVPTLPLGAHRRPLKSEADLSLRGQAGLLAEFIERLELEDVTLIQSDHGLAQVVAADRPDLVARLVLAPQEAFDNYPPGLPGKLIGVIGKLPGGLFFALQQLRLGPFRRSPLAFGWMSKRVPDEMLRRWFKPARKNRQVRRDLAKYLRSVDKHEFVEVADKLRRFSKPALVVWSTEDRIMPPAHGRRLAEILPNARLVEVADSYTLVAEDQPRQFAQAIRQFVTDTEPAREGV